jgi:hypothetical protein
MNKQYTVKSNINGLFLVSGKGFVASKQSGATKFSADDAKAAQECAANLGVSTSLVEVKVSSYAVNYVRGINLKNGTVEKDERNPSKRRFATRDEAIQHGSRFAERRANAGDQPGTAGHIGFYVTETTDPVNAAINWKTGLTNPVDAK